MGDKEVSPVPWLEIFGWLGSLILVVSMMQQRIMRLRVINLVGCIIHIIYNAIVGVWPMVGLNVVLAAIQIINLWRLLHTRHDDASYQVVDLAPDNPYLQVLLREHARDIAKFNPGCDPGTLPQRSDHAFLIMRGSETVGYVFAHDAGEHTAQIDLDYVTEKYRDFTPGEFVFADSAWFTTHGFQRVRTRPDGPDYYGKIGFRRDGEAYVKALETR